MPGFLDFRFPGCVASAFPKSGHSRLDGAYVAKHLIPAVSIVGCIIKFSARVLTKRPNMRKRLYLG